MIKTNLMLYYAEMLYWIYLIHLDIVLLVLLLFICRTGLLTVGFTLLT